MKNLILLFPLFLFLSCNDDDGPNLTALEQAYKTIYGTWEYSSYIKNGHEQIGSPITYMETTFKEIEESNNGEMNWRWNESGGLNIVNSEFRINDSLNQLIIIQEGQEFVYPILELSKNVLRFEYSNDSISASFHAIK